MIFPDIRLSTLRRDFEQKKDRFNQSRHVFFEEFRHNFEPMNFIKSNPKMILSTIIAGATFMTSAKGIYNKFFNFIPNGNGNGKHKLGFIRHAVEMGGLMAFKSMLPVLRYGIKKLVNRVVGR